MFRFIIACLADRSRRKPSKRNRRQHTDKRTVTFCRLWQVTLRLFRS